MKRGIGSSLVGSLPNTCRTIRPFVEVLAGRFLTLSRKSWVLWTVWILLKAKTILLSCQARQRVLSTTLARCVFQGNLVGNRSFNSFM
jgi:hypothetical protein